MNTKNEKKKKNSILYIYFKLLLFLKVLLIICLRLFFLFLIKKMHQIHRAMWCQWLSPEKRSIAKNRKKKTRKHWSRLSQQSRADFGSYWTLITKFTNIQQHSSDLSVSKIPAINVLEFINNHQNKKEKRSWDLKHAWNCKHGTPIICWIHCSINMYLRVNLKRVSTTVIKYATWHSITLLN